MDARGPHDRVEELVNRQLTRAGGRAEYLLDPYSHHMTRLTTFFLRMAEAAMLDEGIDPGTADNVIKRLVYGTIPCRPDGGPATAEQIKAREGERLRKLMDRPVPPMPLDRPPTLTGLGWPWTS